MPDARELFLKMPGWFDELPADQQRAIEALRADVGKPPGRLIPQAHGNEFFECLRNGAQEFRKRRDPFCLVRVSDCELGMLGAGYLPSTRLHDLSWHFMRAGYGRASLSLRAEYIEAIRGAEMVGLQQFWALVTEDTAVLLAMLGIPMPLPNGVEMHLPYALLVDGSLFSYLRGKSVLFIGALASRLATAWRDPAFIKSHSRFGPMTEIRVAGAVNCAPRFKGGSSPDLERVTQEVLSKKFDVALLACGMAAKVLAWRIRKSGRTALDVGFVFDALLGHPERTQRPVFERISWPTMSWYEPEEAQ
jgi:hypothetical protein